MRLSELDLSVTNAAFLLENLPQKDRANIIGTFREVAPSVLDHHQWTCMFCGYREEAAIARGLIDDRDGSVSESQLEAIPLNGNYSDTDAENLGVACVFCRAAHAMNTVTDTNDWMIIVAPGLSQPLVSWLARTFFFMSLLEDRVGSGGTSTGAEAYEIERGTQRVVDEVIAAVNQQMNTSRILAARYNTAGDVRTFADSLSRMVIERPESYQDRRALLSGFRIAPAALATDDWAPFMKYRRFMLKAGPYGAIHSWRDTITLARKAFVDIHNHVFPKGDPLAMEEAAGQKTV